MASGQVVSTCEQGNRREATTLVISRDGKGHPSIPIQGSVLMVLTNLRNKSCGGGSGGMLTSQLDRVKNRNGLNAMHPRRV
jgi:hypothetical protein